MGLKVPEQRKIATRYGDLARMDLQALLNNRIHEFRLIALMILSAQYEAAATFKDKEQIVDFYLKNTRRINNWDLVDSSAYKILGTFLLLAETIKDKKAAVNPKFRAKPLLNKLVLNKLAASSNLWSRRIAIVATYAFIKTGRSVETFKIAERLLKDKHDLIHKAVGWMLREVGKRVGEKDLRKFLDKNYRQLPRTTLRYAIERLSPATRERYLLK